MAKKWIQKAIKRPGALKAKARSGNYPIQDRAHARNALARVSQHGTPAEKARVQRAVDRKYPGLRKRKNA